MSYIRPANTTDAIKIREIYSPFITDSAVSFETEVPEVSEIERRMSAGMERFPWLVYDDGNIGGYVYASPHRDRAAYQWACECSVYLDPAYRGKGVAKHLYAALFEILKIQGLVNVYAGITLPNDNSIKLHEACGFRQMAMYENVGYKKGIWHNVGWWTLQLNEPMLQPPPPLKFPELGRNTVAGIIDRY